MSKVLQALRDLALLIARIGLGAIMIVHGWRRWQVMDIQPQVEYLNQFKTPYPNVAVWGSIILELVGGIFMIVGALTPLIALAFLVQQVLIISYTNWYTWDAVFSSTTPYNASLEHNVALGLLALVFVFFGAGKVSIDRLFKRKKPAEEDLEAAETA